MSQVIVREKSGTFPTAPGEEVDLRAAAEYVCGRQTPLGGFCFYRDWGVEEPNAADTFFATSTLATLEAAATDPPAVRDWIMALQSEDGSYPDTATAWYAVESLACLGEQPRRVPSPWLSGRSGFLFGEPASGHRPRELLLETARYLELCGRFGVPLENRYAEAVATLLRTFQDPGGAFPRGAPTLVDSAVALRIAAAAGLMPDRRLLAYAKACEDPVYGFRALPSGRSTHLAVLDAGIRILAAFGVAVRYSGALRRTIAACQMPGGGFGRHLGAVATLHDTWLAVTVLQAANSAPTLTTFGGPK